MHKQTQPQRPCYVMTDAESSGIRVLEVLKSTTCYRGLKLYVAFWKMLGEMFFFGRNRKKLLFFR